MQAKMKDGAGKRDDPMGLACSLPSCMRCMIIYKQSPGREILVRESEAYDEKLTATENPSYHIVLGEQSTQNKTLNWIFGRTKRAFTWTSVCR